MSSLNVKYVDTTPGLRPDHGDYSKKEGGKVTRTTKDKDTYDSDHFSKSDKTNMSEFAKGQDEHTAVLGTPSGQIRTIDFKASKLNEETAGGVKIGVASKYFDISVKVAIKKNGATASAGV